MNLQRKSNFKLLNHTSSSSKTIDLNRCFSCPENNFHFGNRSHIQCLPSEQSNKISNVKDSEKFIPNEPQSKIVHSQVVESSNDVANQMEDGKISASKSHPLFPSSTISSHSFVPEKFCTKSDIGLQDNLRKNQNLQERNFRRGLFTTEKKISSEQILTTMLERKTSLENLRNLKDSKESPTNSSVRIESSDDKDSLKQSKDDSEGSFEMDERLLMMAVLNVSPVLKDKDGVFVLNFLNKIKEYESLLIVELSRKRFAYIVDQLAVTMTEYFMQEDRPEQKYLTLQLLRDIVVSVERFKNRISKKTPLSKYLMEELKCNEKEGQLATVAELLLAITNTSPGIISSLLSAVDNTFVSKVLNGVRNSFKRKIEDICCNTFLELLLRFLKHSPAKYCLIEILLKENDTADLIEATVNGVQHSGNPFVVTSSRELLMVILKITLVSDLFIPSDHLNMIFDVFTGDILSAGDYKIDDLNETLKILQLLMTSSQFTAKSVHWNRMTDVSQILSSDESTSKLHKTQLEMLCHILKKQMQSLDHEGHSKYFLSKPKIRQQPLRSFDHGIQRRVSASLPEISIAKLKDNLF